MSDIDQQAREYATQYIQLELGQETRDEDRERWDDAMDDLITAFKAGARRIPSDAELEEACDVARKIFRANTDWSNVVEAVATSLGMTVR